MEPTEISGGGAVNIEVREHPERFSPDFITGGEPDAPPLSTSFDAFKFDDNNTLGAGLWIPPDPDGAVGPNHVVNVVNVSLEWWTKAGVNQNQQTLKNFFASQSPVTATFDPKVVYDQFAGRFVVVTLEQTGSPQTSKVFVAVSDDSNPNGTWFFQTINTKVNIGGTDTWADFPGLAVDEEAVYLTNNMFNFPGTAGFGPRLWILNKGLYSGGVSTVALHDPIGATGAAQATSQPAQIYGSAPAGVGTWLVGYSGLNAAGNVKLQLIRIDNPLGATAFTLHQLNWGTTGSDDNTGLGLLDAPQSGTATLIETNDRRVSNTPVWRNNQLYASAPIRPPTGTDANQTTAHWWRVNTTTLASPSIADQGNVGGESIAAGTYTFFPTVAVDSAGNMGIGFAASAPSIFGGAYYTGRLSGDAAGSTQPPSALAAGTDFYIRTFGGGRNRWGDYASIDVDPADDTSLWLYNEYAMARGTPTPEDGRWATRWGKFTLGGPPPGICSKAGDVLTINVPSGASVSIGRSGVNFNVTGGGNPDPGCGGSTVNNINTVNVNGAAGAETVTYDTSGGNFEPGMTAEGSGISEIEFNFALGAGTDSLLFLLGAANDKLTIGSTGINPNNDTDGDHTYSGLENLTASGGNGNDALSAGGKKGTGGAYPSNVTFSGGAGKDTITGGLGNDSADGGTGKDTFKALNVADGADDFVGGADEDTASYSARKAAAGGVTVDPDGVADDGTKPGGEGDNIRPDVENVTGSKGDDTVTDGGLVLKNVFKGGDGNDNLNAVDGVNNGDTVDGGGGAGDVCSADAGETITNCP